MVGRSGSGLSAMFVGERGNDNIIIIVIFKGCIVIRRNLDKT